MTEQQIAAMRQALEALKKYCTPYQDGTHPADEAITALTAALADHALDKKAENAREIGLDYDAKSDHRLMKQPAQQEPVAWMYEWTTPDGEFIQGMTTDDFSSLKDPIGKITNIRPLYFANSESVADVAVYKAFEKFGEPTAFICQGNLYWGTDIDPLCTADHIPLYVRFQARDIDIGELEQESRLLRARNERLQRTLNGIVPRLENACGAGTMPPTVIKHFIEENAA